MLQELQSRGAYGAVHAKESAAMLLMVLYRTVDGSALLQRVTTYHS
jgi:hypothetical protein